MTQPTDRPAQADLSQQDGGDDPRVRQLRVVAIVLAILSVGLAVALVATAAANGDDDATADTIGSAAEDAVDAGGGVVSAPADVIQVVDGFARAFEEQDVALAESIIAEDFTSNADLYNLDTTEPAFTARLTPNSLRSELAAQAWNVDRSGELLVAGDGPWVVAARETWSDRVNHEEGVRLYIVVDENGTPKLSGYYYVGIKYPVEPDFGN